MYSKWFGINLIPAQLGKMRFCAGYGGIIWECDGL